MIFHLNRKPIKKKKKSKKPDQKRRENEVVEYHKITFWLMIHFSVKIGLNLYSLSRVMIYRRSTANERVEQNQQSMSSFELLQSKTPNKNEIQKLFLKFFLQLLVEKKGKEITFWIFDAMEWEWETFGFTCATSKMHEDRDRKFTF